jgi:ferredoxin
MPVDALKDPTTVKQTIKRKRKPRIVAVINDSCTGCAGSPACVDYCPVESCMVWVTDPEAPTLGRIEVDPLLCIGCKLCISKGPEDTFLDGCPWDAIDMVDITQVEAGYGSLPW